ncbi:MAG TPA: EAL domain-containing protein [Gammaproteobacteria bacterium]|jgi:diguanylate cyclase (GGDEF)-like protein/PAS domain S-box-containing protein
MGIRRAGRTLGSVRGSYLVALAVLASALLLTAIIYRVTLNNEAVAHQARFTSYAEEVANTINARFARYEAVLDAGAGLFVSNGGHITRKSWQQFNDTIDVDSKYPGISSYQYLSYVRDAELPRFLAQTRADGAPDFTITPAERHDYYCPITYTAPRSTVRYLRGFNPCHAEMNQGVLDQARDTGTLALSKPLDLRDVDGKLQRGVVAVRALYRNGEDASTPAKRRAALYGWLAEILPMDKVVTTRVLPSGVNMDVRIEDTSLQGADAVIFDNGGGAIEETGHWWQRMAHYHATYTTTLAVGGRNWRLSFAEEPGVAWIAVLILLAGFMVSVPVTLLVLNLGLTRSRALKLAARMTDSLREQEQMLSSITGNIADGIYRSTPDKGMIYANEALARMFGYHSAAELMNVAGPILYANPRRRQELTQLLDDRGHYRNEEVEYQRKDGTRFFAVNSATTVKDEDGAPIYFDGVISDITERKRAEAQVYQLAHYDSLTGLPNRALLRDRLGQAMHDARRRGGKLAVMYLDLDRFKTVNDSLGHETGDKLLKAVATRLRECMRDSDTISRQGGDEFLLILRDCNDPPAVARVAEKLQEAVAKPTRIGEYELHVTPSIGISLFPDDADDIDELIRNADAAMYHAKENGRFNFQFFTPEMNTRAYERLSLEGSLRQAIERQEFRLEYQPQVDLRTGKIMGVEALLRWQRQHEHVPPSVFVPVLESSGMIGQVGEWVLREACRQNREWQSLGLPPISMAVNLSAIQFNRRNMADTISTILAETGLEPRWLELEFTESAVMHDSREVAGIIGRLDDLGVQLALDDFGTGYSSLSYLRRFHLDKLKIDQSFVRDIDLDVDDAAIVAAIIGMARNLKVVAVAEGVETRAQWEFLRTHGCEGMQGYLFSKPLTPQAFADLLKSGRTLTL